MRVVVVGGGFGGVISALELSKQKQLRVTLISDSPHFHYQPGLYRTVTGISPLEAAIPLREIFADAPVAVELDKIVTIDNRLKIVTSAIGNHYRYDKLVLAVGCVTNYFGIDGLAENSFSLKSVPDALAIRHHLHKSLTNFNGKTVQYAIVGAGPTGVELAAELTFYLRRLCKMHQIRPGQFEINLIEAAERILPGMRPEFSARLTKRLERLGVKIHTDTTVKGSRDGELSLPGGSIKTQTVIWTAGVANHPLFKEHAQLFETDQRGRIKVNEHLEAARDIFVIGDNAATTFSGMAQTALHNGRFVADHLRRYIRDKPLRAYEPKEPVYVVPAGRRWAGLAKGNLQLYGRLAWWLRRAADLRLLNDFLPVETALGKWRSGNRSLHKVCLVCDYDLIVASEGA